MVNISIRGVFAMDLYNSGWYAIWHRITGQVSKVNWVRVREYFTGYKHQVTDAEQERLLELLKSKNYLILTQEKAYLSSWLIRIMSYIATGVFPTYSHVLMNSQVGSDINLNGFELIEATNAGVHASTFSYVFDCDNTCILDAGLTDAEWGIVMLGLRAQLGRSYDDVFNLHDSTHVSCVEMCLLALQALPDFQERFPHLVEMIKRVDQLTPEMYRDCEDFKIVFETQH